MTATLVEECIEVISDYTGVSLTPDQFANMIANFPSVWKTIVEFESPRDTADREALMDALAMHVTGRRWPMYMDGEDALETFMNELKTKSMHLGYKFND